MQALLTLAPATLSSQRKPPLYGLALQGRFFANVRNGMNNSLALVRKLTKRLCRRIQRAQDRHYAECFAGTP